MKRTLARLLLVAVGVLVELVLIEVALRAVAKHPRDDALDRARSELTLWFDLMHAGLYETSDDERLLFTLARTFDVTVDGVRYRTNDLGLRGPTPPPDEMPKRTRIALLGDSYAFGLGVPEDATIGAWIERTLRASGHAVDVLNLGTPAHHTGQETAWLERVAPALDLDVVVLLFYDNDAIFHGLRWDTRRRFLYNDELPVPRWVRETFGNTFLYAWLGSAYTRRLSGGGLLNSGPQYWPVTRLRLERLTSLCRERNLRLVIANLPFIYWTTYMADPVQFAKHAELYDLVASFARDHDTPWVDLLARISPSPSHFARAALTLPGSGLSQGASCVVATALTAWLQSHAWFPVEFLMIAPRTEDFDNHFNATGCRLVGEAIASMLHGRL